MNRERAWNIITLLCFINLVLLAFKFLTSSPIKEPEFINSYCIMTSDDSFESLPREIGTIKRHENIVSNTTGVLVTFIVLLLLLENSQAQKERILFLKEDIPLMLFQKT